MHSLLGKQAPKSERRASAPAIVPGLFRAALPARHRPAHAGAWSCRFRGSGLLQNLGCEELAQALPAAVTAERELGLVRIFRLGPCVSCAHVY